MKKLKIIAAIVAVTFAIQSCEQADNLAPQDEVSSEVLSMIINNGFDVENQAPITFDNGYLIEGDIYVTEDQLRSMKPQNNLRLASEEQYSTNNLVSVSGSRNISLYIPVASTGRGKKTAGFSATYVAALDEAIDRYNAQNLNVTMSRVTSSGADIDFTRLGKGDERRGILGSAGFPTSSGDPYGNIKMSGVLESSYGLSVDGIATIMAHEIGHCVGFRHTDFFDRSISCGGGTSNEGDGGVGANHIPGTPTGANPSSDLSWMLACTDGGDRPFTNNDQTALGYLY